MSIRYVIVLGVAGVIGVTAVSILAYGWIAHDLRHMIAGATVAVVASLTSLVVWSFGRINCMVRAYRMGYRTGRNDANARLLEDGFWISEKAEEDARRSLGPDDGDLIP